MPRLRTIELSASAALWIVATCIAAGARFWIEPELITVSLAVAASALGAGAALLVGSGRMRAPWGDRRDRVALFGAPVAAALVAISGGARSPAVVLLGLCALAAAWGRRPRTGAMTSGIALLAVAAVHLIAVGHLPPVDLVNAAALLGAVGVLPVWLAARAAGSIAEARRRSEQLERFLAGPRVTPQRLRAAPSDLRHDAVLTQEQAEERRQFEALAALLRDVRDLIGADEVIYWRLTKTRDAMQAAAWSSDGLERPTHFSEEWTPFVQWAAQERLVQCDAPEGVPLLAAAPVLGDGNTLGAVSVWAAKGLRATREELHRWLPRHAANLARLTELLDTRREFARQNVQTTALLSAAQNFQQQRDVDTLGASICATALQVTSGQRAMLVRWYGEEGCGVVESAAGEDARAVGLRVDGDSLVGRMCRNGLPQVWEDARHVGRAGELYGPGEGAAEVGSLGIYPLKRDLSVLGALVIEGSVPGTVLIKDIRNVKLLSMLAALSLETVWQIEEVTRRAVTDTLTGLYNRLHFDDQLERVLNESDRFAHPCSLIVADIDFFKRVNDTHGHDVGDAVLRTVAAVFRDGVRTVDVCARYGGEEIVVLLPETGLAGAQELAERLRRAVEAKLVRVDGKEIEVTASFGVACYPESARTRDALFPAADRALYQAKHDGRNCVRTAAVNSRSQTS